MLNQEKTDLSSLKSKLQFIQNELLSEYKSEQHKTPWIVGYSGGKDSTLIVQLVLEMILGIAPSERNREIHILCNDTLVESPVLSNYIDKMLERLKEFGEALQLPIKVIKTTPTIDQTFWVNLIGRGYPPPTRSFRWCTDRMKIEPTSNYILNQVSANGEAILLLGVRKAESTNRANSIKKHKNIEGTRLNPHGELNGCLVFRPIVDLTTEEVWLILMQRTPPWGGSHRDLITLYRNAQGGECPLIVDKSDAPSCGSSSSRFGCWTCTVVKKDKSMEGFIDAGYENLEPLLEFRDWLKIIRDDKKNRMLERRNGKITLMEDGVTTVPGPFTFEVRELILLKLLKIQEDLGVKLICEAEINRIKEIWNDDSIAKASRHLAHYELYKAGKTT